MEDLRGRTAVVTGGASGIGLALGCAFAAEGMKVVLADIEPQALAAAKEQVVAAAGAGGAGAVHTVDCDVSDPDALERLRDETVATFGTAHVVCNNAGVGGGGQIWAVPLEMWRWVLCVNLMGVVHGIRSFLPLLLEQNEGHVVNTASAAGLLTSPYLGPYSASKHAVVALTESLAMELDLAATARGAENGVGVSVLCPMWVRTRIHESDRNAPAEVLAAALASGDEERGVGGAGMRDLIAGLVTGGLDPRVVAGQVVEAVKERRFYVLPHDEVSLGVLARARRIAEGEPPQATFGA